MKSIKILLGMIFASSLITSLLFAEVEVKTTNSFSNVAKIVQEKNFAYQTDQVLIVLDIDNTLLTGSVDLGSDIWFQWQLGKLETKPTEKQKVANLFSGPGPLLTTLLPQKLTESNLAELISSWQEAGNTAFALTSRAPTVRAATERELLRNGIDFTKSALAPAGAKSLPVYREKLKREIDYMQGIMMTTGLNKGEMLNYILKKTGRSFAAIVFVDDSESNISKVEAEFSKLEHKSMDFVAVHYTKIEIERIKKYGTVVTQAQANKMDRDWKKLYRAIKTSFPIEQTMLSK